MSTTPRRLVNGSTLTNTATTVYTVPSNTRARIAAFAATNDGASPETITAHLVATGSTASSSNQIAKAVSLNTSETKSITGAIGQVMEAGSSIQVLQGSTNQNVNVVISGYEIV